MASSLLPQTAKCWRSAGFALISSISITSLTVLLSLALLGLSTQTSRRDTNLSYQAIAKANAMLAMKIAISQLQETLGRDQSVCATASMFEKPDRPVPNRHWLGAWRSTVEFGGVDYPVVGKNSDLGGPEPYRYKALYSDLRYTDSMLNAQKWKKVMRSAWLVSGGDSASELDLLTAGNGAVELLGKGSLGLEIEDSDFQNKRVLVPTVNIERNGELTGKYAYWVSNNNLKAKLGPLEQSEKVSNEIIVGSNLGGIVDEEGRRPYASLQRSLDSQLKPILSLKSVELSDSTTWSSLQADYHDFTYLADGLHTNTQLGGFKKDLSALLFGKRSQHSVKLEATTAADTSLSFDSSYPIIPGARKAVMGPSFDALRAWGLSRFMQKDGSNGVKKIEAQTQFTAAEGMRFREADGWNRGMSDGMSAESSRWADLAPKIHPVMTESRYHYYLSFTGSSSDRDSNVRMHLMPRVCLWNPYSVRMEMPRMVVLMPNPFAEYDGEIELQLDTVERKRLQQKYSTTGTTFDPITGERDSLDIYASWKDDSVRIRGRKDGDKRGYMPAERFLGFEIEATTFEPGQCLVFSPKIVEADVQSDGRKIKAYDAEKVSSNVLSAKEKQGEDHFYWDYEIGKVRIKYSYTKPKQGENGTPLLDENGNLVFDHSDSGSTVSGDSWSSELFFSEVDFSKVHTYKLWIYSSENWPFVLKGAAGDCSISADLIATDRSSLYPTLQLINNGNGGTRSHNFLYYSWYWGSSSTASAGTFGYLEDFNNAPLKVPPRLHHVGSKMTWFDESMAEAYAPPLRVGRWSPDNIAYNFPVIAHGNVRPHLVSRNPSSQCGAEWYTNVHGSWLHSFSPLGIDDVRDTPAISDEGYFYKNPFGAAKDLEGSVILFDLPDPDYGAASMGSLMHAHLSPYSWHPSYIIGSSLAGLSAPSFASAQPSLDSVYSAQDPNLTNSFDYWCGGITPYTLSWGPKTVQPDNQQLLQLGDSKTNKVVDDELLESQDEILAYDIAFEVNHNLWDDYFLSAMPLSEDTLSFNFSGESELTHTLYSFNSNIDEGLSSIAANLSSAEGLAEGFWKNGYYLKNNIAFNVNSTSVKAWASYLSGWRDRQKSSVSGEIGRIDHHLYSRISSPYIGNEVNDPEGSGGSAFSGVRLLSDEDIQRLANAIVSEVKLRGPFLSLSDFVNRRLSAPQDQSSLCGVLEAAIRRSGINSALQNKRFQISQEAGSNNNHADWKADLARQADSKIWGSPGYMIQADILKPLAPLLTVRGDTFTIRSYGEARRDGEIVARAYLETVVVRTPSYTELLKNGGNHPLDGASRIAAATGEIIKDPLSEKNRRFGRRFKVVSRRWLSPKEI